MKFIKVTGLKTGNPFYINTRHICCIEKSKDRSYTVIEYTREAAGEDYIAFVKETPEEILSQLES
jgi:uncharacterized protein YlzI (FlbEa/FlbD family)